MSEDLSFPPLMWGEEVRDDALGHATRRATLGCDSGLVAYALGPSMVEAALVVTPEVPLAAAMTMMPLCGVGFQNALGALAPPEVAVHLEWAGGVRVNGAACGRLGVAASTHDATKIPDWLVVGISIPFLPQSEDMGRRPDETALYAEGCADVEAPRLVEAFARHTLNWITRWESDGSRDLHAEWRGMAHGIGETVNVLGQSGTYLGVDEHFGMLFRAQEGETTVIPLTQLLEEAP